MPDAVETDSAHTCPACGYRGIWQSYFCGRCGEHDDQKYRDEHRDRARSYFLNRADIIAEYREAGIPFRPTMFGG